jgi:integrase
MRKEMATRYRNKNTGSISKRYGKHRAQFYLPNGKRTSSTFRTHAEAEKWLRDQHSKLDQGFDFQGSKTTLAEYLPKWLETRKIDLRPKTAHNYRQTITKHIIPFLGTITLQDLSLVKIEKFYADLVQSGVGTRTIRICHNILHKSLEKALRYGLVTHNPAHGAALPRYTHSEMQVLDQTQVGQFLIAAQSSSYCALFHLAITTGMRQGELFGLKWPDLQWLTGTLHIQRQVQRVSGQGWSFVEPKTKAGRRTIKLGEGTIQILREHRAQQEIQKVKAGQSWQENDLIFPNEVGDPGDPSNLRKDFQKTLARAGLSLIRFHDLRHTAASLLLNNNVPLIVVSKMLGHTKPSITMDIYGHLYHESQGEAAEIMDKLVTPIPNQLPQGVKKAPDH